MRHDHYEVALALGAFGSLILIVSSLMMMRAGDWGSVDEWGAVATEPRQRRNLLILAAGALALGAFCMWLGFGSIPLISQVLLVVGGWLLLLCGVVGLTAYLLARKLFA